MLAMRGIVKRYGAVVANDGIDLDVGAGRIVGLLGENGSGKSTLMRVLFGMTRPDEGAILFRGRALAGHDPAVALAAGLGMIHQHLTLVEAATVLDNVMLGWAEAGRRLRRRAIAARVRATSAALGLDLDPDARVADLPLGRRQRVEILKAVLRGAELLILDEPTSNLAPPEIDGLLAVLRRLRSEGKGVVFISHKLGEVLSVCDEVVVLRGGRVVSRGPVAGASRDDLAAAMVDPRAAATIETRFPAEPRPVAATGARAAAGAEARAPVAAARGLPRGPARLAVRGLAAPGLGPLDLAIPRGRVLGIAGVDGNGQVELVETVAGLRRASAGSIAIDGRDITGDGVASRVAAGLATMPADRARTSLAGAMTIAENLRLRRGRAPVDAAALMARFDIRAAHPGVAAGTLSGGNQQKIVVAREIGSKPAVLLAHQATSGLDPGATRFVLAEIASLRDAGAAVLYVSSELDEILLIADEVAVLFEGRLLGPVARADADGRRLGAWMSGVAAA